MRFLFDESVRPNAARVLLAAGHDVLHASATKLAGSPDRVIIQTAAKTRRILVTHDRRLADLRNPAVRRSAGIVVLRPNPGYPDTELLVGLLRNTPLSDLNGNLTICKRGKLRVRPLEREALELEGQ